MLLYRYALILTCTLILTSCAIVTAQTAPSTTDRDDGHTTAHTSPTRSYGHSTTSAASPTMPHTHGTPSLRSLLRKVDARSVTGSTRPPQTEPIDDDEAGLWFIMDKAEKETQTSGLLVRDPKLNAYVRGLVCDMAGEYCKDLRVYIVNRPYFNAMMAPNGYMEIWSGLLLRAQNEAQLSFVIGHEIGHFIEDHSIEAWRRQKRTARTLMAVSILGAAGGAPEVGQLGELVALASLFGFSRDNEREADRIGLELIARRGYSVAEPAESWSNLIAETQSSDFRKVRRSPTRNSIFNTHPVTTERVANLTSGAATHADSQITNEAYYRSLISPFLIEWLEADLQRRDYGQSLYTLNRLAEANRDMGVINFFKGEAYRERDEVGDKEAAIASYMAAAKHADAPAATWRQLGQIYEKQKNYPEAISSYRHYLAKAPAAEDRAIIEFSLQALQMRITK